MAREVVGPMTDQAPLAFRAQSTPETREQPSMLGCAHRRNGKSLGKSRFRS